MQISTFCQRKVSPGEACIEARKLKLVRYGCWSYCVASPNVWVTIPVMYIPCMSISLAVAVLKGTLFGSCSKYSPSKC